MLINCLVSEDGYLFGVHIDDMPGDPYSNSYWGTDYEGILHLIQHDIPASLVAYLGEYGYCFEWSIIERSIELDTTKINLDHTYSIIRDGYDAYALVFHNSKMTKAEYELEF